MDLTCADHLESKNCCQNHGEDEFKIQIVNTDISSNPPSVHNFYLSIELLSVHEVICCACPVKTLMGFHIKQD